MSKYPVKVQNNIFQYDEHLFVWLNETFVAGGAAHSLEQAERELAAYAEILNAAIPETHKMLALSNAHVSLTTSRLLEGWADLASPPGAPIAYQKGDYGWFVVVPPLPFDYDEYHLVTPDLWDCFACATANKCTWIMFDRDVEPHDKLTVHDW